VRALRKPGREEKKEEKKKKEGKGRIHARDMEKERVGGEGRRGWREGGRDGNERTSPGGREEGKGVAEKREKGRRKKKKTFDNAVTGGRVEGETSGRRVFRGCFIGWFPWGGNSV